MPLIAEPPPSTLPANHSNERLSAEPSGSDMKNQSDAGSAIVEFIPAGILNSSPSPGGPASSSTTRLRLSSESRLATTHPALPPPAMMKSAASSIRNEQGP